MADPLDIRYSANCNYISIIILLILFIILISFTVFGVLYFPNLQKNIS